MSKHTPGPWSIRPIGGYPIIQSKTGVLVAKTDCSLNSNNFVSDLNTARANADLIASAPELLEALEECITTYGATCFKNGAPNGDDAWRRIIAINEIATAAIAKAKGEA